MAKKTTPVRKAVKSERPKPKSSVKPVPAKQAKAQSEAKGKPVKPTVQPTSNMVDSKRQLKIQKALYEIADTASSVKDMQSFYKKLHKIVGKLMYAENFIITLYDSATNMRSFPYYVDSAGDTASEPNPVPPGSIYADMLLHPVTLHFDRKRNEEETRAGRLGGTVAEDFVAVPLIENGQVIGGIIVQSYVKDIRYSDEDVAVLEFMAKHIATALTRARAIEETRQRNAELQVINSVQEGLASKLDFQGIVDLVGDKIQSIFNADIMMIAFKDPKENLVHYPYVIGDEKRYNIKSSKPGGFSGEVLKTGKSIVVNEHFDDRKVEFGSASLVADDPNAKQPQIKSAIYIPIKGNNAAIGVVSLQTEEREHAFSEASVRLLETIASSMGVALENARLFDETQRLFKAEQERVAELQIINSIQQGLAAELDFQAIVDLVGDKLREVFNTPDLIISWYDENANLLHYIYVYEHGKRLTTEPQTPVQGGRFETIRKSKQPVVWNTQAEYVGGVIPGTDQSKSLISVPIISSDRVLGLISIENFERENAFGESEQRLLSTISASLGNALENARLFKAEQERVAELQIINSVQQGLAAELDFQAIVDLVGDKLREVFSNGDLTITWYDEKAKLVNYLYGYEHGKRLPFMSRPPNPGGIYETEIKTRKPIIFNNAADYAKLNMTVIPGTDQSKSIISVPIISSDRFLGDISMENYERENAFGESEQRLLTTIAASLGTALENARLFDETQRLLKITEDRAAELAIINSVQAALAAELNIQGIYDAVGDKIREIFHQADMGIRIYDSQTNLIHYPYTYENGQRISIESSPLSEKGFAAHVIHNRQTLVINENMAEVEKQYGSFTIPGTGESKSELFVPLIVGEQARGLINLSDYEREHAFSDSDVRLLQTLANAMSVALENARLFDETQRLLKETEQRNAELKIINSVQQGVSSKLEFQAIIDLVGDKLREIFRTGDMGIAWYDEKTNLAHQLYAYEHGVRLTPPPPSTPKTKAWLLMKETRKPIVVNTSAEALDMFGPALAGTDESKSLVRVPIIASDRLIGAITIENFEQEYGFSESDVRLLETVASSMGVGLENARLFDETQRLLKETEERAQELTVINSIQQGLAAELDFQTIIDMVGDKLRAVLNTGELGIRWYDEEANLIHYLYEFEHGVRIQIPTAPPRSQTWEKLVRTRKPIILNSVQEMQDMALSALPGTDSSKSMASVPIIGSDRVLGSIITENYERESAFTEANIRLLTTVASSMGVALENARLFNETQRLLKETEQRNAELAIINGVQQGLATKLDMQAIYDLVGDKINEIFDAQGVAIMRYDHTAKLLLNPYIIERGQRFYPTPTPLTVFAENMIRTKQLVVINQDAERKVEEYGMRIIPGTELAKSIVFVPLIVGDQVNGVISLENIDHENAFSESDVRLLQTLANSMSVALENARLFDETQRLLKETEQRNAELAIINSVQQGLASKLDFQAVVDLVGDKLREVLNTGEIGIRWLDSETGLIHYLYEYEHGERLTVEPREATASTIWKKLMETHQPVVYHTAEDYLGEGYNILPGTDQSKSMATVPIIAGDQVIGSILSENYERENAYSDSDVRLMQTIAASMGVALQNARLFDETSRHARESAALTEVGRDISSTLDLSAVMDRIAAHASELLNAETSAMFLPEAGGSSYRAIVAHGVNADEIKADSIQAGEGIIGALAQQGKAEFINDTGKDPRSVQIPGTVEQSEERLMVAPLLTGDKVSGMMAVWRAGGATFTSADLVFLQELSLQAAIAIKNANLFDETEQRAAELAIINSVQEGLASKLEIQAIYDLVGDKVTEIFHSDTTYIQSYNAKEQSVYAHYYVERGQHQQPGPLPFGRGLYSKVIQSRQPILYGTQEEWLKAGGTIINSPGQERELNESVLLVPILLGSEVTGVLSIQSYKQNAFGKSDERLLQTLANSMSVALENARLFDETQRLLQETEQRNAELAIINSVQQGLASKLELQALYDLVGDKIRDIFDAQSVLIATYDHVTRTRSFPYNWEKGERIYIPGGSPFNKLAEHLIATRETVVINESALERGTELGMSQVPGTAAMMSGVFVPLVTGDTVTGFISLQNVEREHAFSESDVRLLQTLASSMSVALESARLFDETQRLLKETEQRNAELAIINKVQEGLASKLEMEAIYNLVGDEVRSIFDAQAVLIVTYDRAANLFHYPYNIEKGERFYVEPTEPMGFSKHMLTTRQPILIKNNFVKHYEEITGRQVQQFTGEQPKSWLGVPLLVGSEVRGTISLQNVDREEAYSESDLRLLNTLAGTMSVALENARLFDETQRLLKETEQRAAELSIINSVQEGLASKLDMQAIYDLVGDKIHQVFNAPTVTLETIDHQIEMIHVRYGLDNGERFTAEPYRYGNITREMLRTRQPVLVRSAAEFDAYGVGTLHGTGTTGSGVFVPLIIGDQIKGKLTIQSERENAFGDSDVRLLQTLSSSMSVALENARLFDETQRLLKETEQRAAELSIINSVQEGLASKLEMQAIYDLVGDKIRDIFDTQSMLIAIFDLESGTDVIPYHMEDGERRYPEPSALTKFERHIIETRQPIMLNEDMEHLAPQYGMQVIPGTDAPKSGMWVPLISGNQARGMISIQNLKRERAYSDADLRLLQTLANSMSVALENARLFDETQRLLKETEQRNAELAIINSVQEGLASKLERQGIIDLIGDKICEVFGIQDMFIGLHDPAKGLIQFPYGKTEGQHDAMSAIPFGQGLSSHVIRTRQPLVINENMQKRGAELGVVMDRDSHHRIKSWVGVPIVVGNSAIGLISLQDLKHEGAFDASKVNLLMTLGNAMGVALESSRLFAETEQRATELAIINGVQEGLASKLEEQAAYELVGEKLRELFDRQGISLIEFDLDKNIRHYRYLLEKGQRIDPPDAAISPSLQYIIDTRKPMLINERIDESMAALGLVSMTVPGTEPVKALLRVPIFIGGQVKGAVGLSNFERENVFTDSDVRLLTTLAGSLSVALESARLFEETKRNAAELATVNTVSSALASELDVSALINLVGEQTRTIFRADIAFVALFDEDTRIINFPYEYGQHLEPLPLGQGLSSKIIESGQPLLINEDIDHRREQLGVPVLGKQARSFLGVPISVSGKAIGVVSVQSTAKENIFTEEDVRLLSTIAANVGVALQNARLFAEVKRQGQYLETLFANMPVAIVRVDENAKVITWSPAAEKLFGYTGQEAVGKDVDSLVANSDAVREEAVNYSRQSIGNQAVHSITRRTRKDGTLVDVDLSAIPLPLENGKMGIVAIYNDVGEIQRQRTYYEGIVQNSPVAIVTVDPEGNIVSWNPGAEQLFGYMRDEAIDHNVDDLVASSGDLRAEAQTYNKQASADELHVITKRTRKDGSLVDVELSGVPLALPNGKSGLVAIYHDITELQRARQEAIAANEAKSSFLATMSHEIRTPMNAVIGMSGLLLDTELNTEQHDYAETIRNSGDSLLNIINDILDFSKIEAGRMELESQPFDLRDCVESALDLVTARAVEKGIDTAYILDDDVPAAILGDVTRLRQILLNLFSNAVKFTERGEVVLTVHAKSARRKKYVELAFSVRDTGIGLSKEGMGRLFQSFSQADSSTTRKYGGTGLGLAISKRLAEMMDGTMWAESEGLGKGSTFTFTINVPVAEHSPVKHREFVGVQPELREKRVLIVDDNATNRRILVAQTSKWGMGSAETESPVQALQWLKDGQTFDLAILDMHMPEMDGVALATEIRGLNLSLPLVLFSSLGRREVGDKAELFSAYLTKPIKQSQLFDTLVSIFADTQRIRERKTDPTHVALDPEMASRHPLHILLAEDNQVNQKLALRFLEQMGYRADVASNGLEAIESVERQRYDVILMDVQMPEMDGLDATRAIRKLKNVYQPRIVAMTANAMQGDREMCIAAGMDDYISKPIRVPDLVEALEKVNGK